MDWNVYKIAPIDFGWKHLRTVKETLTDIASSEGDFHHPDGLNTSNSKHFLEAWESAKAVASIHGWEGDFREDPSVFWLPSEGDFDYAFAFKQENDGTTFIVSPRALPWLPN